MDKVNIDYLMDIFRAISTELPEQMLYRDNGDSIELKTPDSIGNSVDSNIESGNISHLGHGIYHLSFCEPFGYLFDDFIIAGFQ